MRFWILLLISWALLNGWGCKRGTTVNMHFQSTAFTEGATIPTRCTADGENISPPLEWTGVPSETQSLALIVEDPDAPRGLWVHWVLFNLPKDTQSLPAGVPAKKDLPDGSRQGVNDFKKIGYGGPAPPPGNPHRYFFTLYALTTKLDLPAGASRQEVLEAMRGKIIREAQTMGRYGR